jgi:hypothetical protein
MGIDCNGPSGCLRWWSGSDDGAATVMAHGTEHPLGTGKAVGIGYGNAGFGIVALGAFWLSRSDFGALGILGVGLLFVGVGFLVVAVRPDSIRR